MISLKLINIFTYIKSDTGKESRAGQMHSELAQPPFPVGPWATILSSLTCVLIYKHG
jgi:hypothetical protein